MTLPASARAEIACVVATTARHAGRRQRRPREATTGGRTRRAPRGDGRRRSFSSPSPSTACRPSCTSARSPATRRRAASSSWSATSITSARLRYDSLGRPTGRPAGLLPLPAGRTPWTTRSASVPRAGSYSSSCTPATPCPRTGSAWTSTRTPPTVPGPRDRAEVVGLDDQASGRRCGYRARTSSSIRSHVAASAAAPSAGSVSRSAPSPRPRRRQSPRSSKRSRADRLSVITSMVKRAHGPGGGQ